MAVQVVPLCVRCPPAMPLRIEMSAALLKGRSCASLRDAVVGVAGLVNPLVFAVEVEGPVVVEVTV